MRIKTAAARLGALIIALGLGACAAHGADTVTPNAPTSPNIMRPMDTYGGTTFHVLLGDAAPDLGGETLTHVWIGLKEIDGIENGVSTVLASYAQPRVVDVLTFQDNAGAAIANANVSRIEYQQLRLVVDLASSRAQFLQGHAAVPLNFLVNTATASSVGAGSTTVTQADGPGAVDLVVTQPFSIPQSAQGSVRIDFNAFESLALDAYGNVLARATLFAAPTDQEGRVTGCVLNAWSKPVHDATIAAIAADGSVGGTGFTDSKGNFGIGTLRAGTYKLEIFNAYRTAAGRDVQALGATSAAQSISGPTITITATQSTSAGTLTD